MSRRRPPALAVWLMHQLGYTRQNAALAGDLLEEFQSGRSAGWFWRQTLMVIAHGVSRNAVAQVSYLGAVLAGFLAQTPVVFALWRLQSPPRVHGAGAIALAAILLVAGFAVADLVKRCMAGNWAVLWEIFSYYALAYCICALFAPHFSLSELIVVELVWLTLQVTPALVRVPNAGHAAAAESPPTGGTEALHEYVAHELALRVTLGGGRTIVLRPDAIAVPAFLAADEELATALFQNGAALELLRRATWLACARNYWPVLTNPAMAPAISLRDLAALVKETARTQDLDRACRTQFPETLWKRVYDRLRPRAA